MSNLQLNLLISGMKYILTEQRTLNEQPDTKSYSNNQLVWLASHAVTKITEDLVRPQ